MESVTTSPTTIISLFSTFNHQPAALQPNAEAAAAAVAFRPRTRTRGQPRKRRRKKVLTEKDAFPESLPLHSKNPRTVYADIQRFAAQDKLAQALTILDYLDQRGIPVNPTTFAALVRTKSIDHGKQVHPFIRINGLENNEFLRTKLVQMYTSCGSVGDARQLFNESPSGSVYPWNALLRGNVIYGGRRYREALSTYYRMRALGVEMNVYSFSNVIKSLAGTSAFSQGLKTHALLTKNCFIGSAMLRTSLIDMYFKYGKIKLARRLFEEIDERGRDIVVWGAMISGFARNRLQWQALEYAKRMVDEGIRPNSVILTIILAAIGEVLARKLGREVHAYTVKTEFFKTDVYSVLIN